MSKTAPRPHHFSLQLRQIWSRSPGLRRGIVIGVGLAVIGLSFRALTTESLPDFRDYDDVAEKKDAFFTYLLPYVTQINTEILADRERLLKIRGQFVDSDSAGLFDDRFVRQLASDYDLETPEQLSLDFVDRLLRRVDIIAPSLVLAQAATESGWGTSRFAREGNNLFGMRDYSGDGIVPRRRPAGATWTVAAYDTPGDSIRDLVRSLNTAPPYRQMRTIRHDLRRRDATVTGYALANGLVRYSEKGYEYISQIQSMIRSNDLAQYDQYDT